MGPAEGFAETAAGRSRSLRSIGSPSIGSDIVLTNAANANTTTAAPRPYTDQVCDLGEDF
jgi:hypothetical protein